MGLESSFLCVREKDRKRRRHDGSMTYVQRLIYHDRAVTVIRDHRDTDKLLTTCKHASAD
jgi:hypothetical protein